MIINFRFDGWDQEEGLFEDDILSIKTNPLLEFQKLKIWLNSFFFFPCSFVFVIPRSKTVYAFSFKLFPFVIPWKLISIINPNLKKESRIAIHMLTTTQIGYKSPTKDSKCEATHLTKRSTIWLVKHEVLRERTTL